MDFKQIDKLTMEANNTKKDAADNGKQVILLMERMGCSHVTNSNGKKREYIQNNLEEIKVERENTNENNNHKKLRRVNEGENENKSGCNDDEKEEQEIEKTLTKINGIAFIKERDSLGRLGDKIEVFH